LVCDSAVRLIFLTLPGLGTTTNGATRWLSVGPFLIQPSELIKPFWCYRALASLVSGIRCPPQLAVNFRACALGILLQPNLSTTALCGMTLAGSAGRWVTISLLRGTALSGLPHTKY